MSRLIDADALVNIFNRYYGNDLIEVDDVIGWIEEQPIIEERKTGKWIYKKDLKQFFCDQCGYPSLTDDDHYIYSMDLPNFCPNCGADMRERRTDD